MALSDDLTKLAPVRRKRRPARKRPGTRRARISRRTSPQHESRLRKRPRSCARTSRLARKGSPAGLPTYSGRGTSSSPRSARTSRASAQSTTCTRPTREPSTRRSTRRQRSPLPTRQSWKRSMRCSTRLSRGWTLTRCPIPSSRSLRWRPGNGSPPRRPVPGSAPRARSVTWGHPPHSLSRADDHGRSPPRRPATPAAPRSRSRYRSGRSCWSPAPSPSRGRSRRSRTSFLCSSSPSSASRFSRRW